MILTCPQCATSYFVAESKIPPTGRAVKCASCGSRWTALPEPVLELGADAPVLGVAGDGGDADLADRPTQDAGEDPARTFRAKAEEERKVREAAATGIVWAGMAAALALIVAAAVVFRVDVVRLWPRTAAAYAGVGLPVNSLGLVIEGVRAEPAMQEGHAALSISGVIRNVETHGVEAPPLKISLINRSGRRLTTEISRPADGRVGPGQTRHFALSILDPPTQASELEIAFAMDVPSGGAPAHAAPPAPAAAADAPLVLRGPAGISEPQPHAAPAHE